MRLKPQMLSFLLGDDRRRQRCVSVCVSARGNVVLILYRLGGAPRPENLTVSCPHPPSQVAEKSCHGTEQCYWSSGKAPLGCPYTPTALKPQALPAPGPQGGQAAWEVSVLRPYRARGRTRTHRGCAGPAGRLVVSRRLRAGGDRPPRAGELQSSPELLV